MDFKACSHQRECLTEIQSDFCLWFVCSTSDQCSWTNSWMYTLSGKRFLHPLVTEKKGGWMFSNSRSDFCIHYGLDQTTLNTRVQRQKSWFQILPLLFS